MPKLAIIGDFNPDSKSHQATNAAIAHSSQLLKTSLSYEWIPTENIDENFKEIVQTYNGFWIAPGSPYKNMQAVLRIIEYARLHSIPTLGTCGGFQHMTIEFVRNVLKVSDAQHAEYDPFAKNLVITPLTCQIKGHTLEIEIIDKSSKVFAIYRTEKILGKYYCSFGLESQYQQAIENCGFKAVGIDNHKEVRILELKNHPFFIATLFMPQDNSSEDQPNPLVTALAFSLK